MKKHERFVLKERESEVRLINQRLRISAIVIAVLLIALLSRLTYLAGTQHQYYLTLQQGNQYKLRPIEPTRGIITDRFGVVLANNIPTYSLEIQPDHVNNLQQTIQKLQTLLPISTQEITDFNKQLKLHYRFDHIPLKTGLTKKEMAIVSVNQYQLPGVSVKATLIRHYPLAGVTEAVVGTVGRINADDVAHMDAKNYAATSYIGKSGIEKQYEAELHGKTGYEKVEVNAEGKVIKKVGEIAPIPGSNIQLSIDSKLEQAALNALGHIKGAVVAIEPDTGKVLALVTNPNFNPNLFVTGVSEKVYHTLASNPDQPLFNRALQGLYPMASTIKPFVAIGALNDGVITAQTQIYDIGTFQLPHSQHVFHDWMPGGHGYISLARAIRVSCDTFFYYLANKMGIKNIDQILTAFGFGQPPGINLPSAYSGTIPTPAWKEKVFGQPWYPGNTIITGIGQGYVQATPLQLADGVATIANRGKRMIPNVVLNLKTGNQTTPITPKLAGTITLHNADIWQTVISAMQSVITNSEGTGFRFGRNAPFTAAGKTGTAQVISLKNMASFKNNVPRDLRNHALFIVFAPVEHPKIALAVVAENSLLAPLIARKVVNQYFKDAQ